MRLGFVVNPVAGMGGRVGLKGSDGAETLRRAKELGATESSPARAAEALRHLASLRGELEILTYPGEMGEDEARSVGFEPKVLGKIKAGETTSADTRAAASEMAGFGVDLILFAGGDGTARDIFEVIDGRVPALGIPTGVKIHSGVFAVSPAAAGELASKYLRGEITSVQESEVMDIDEEAFRENRLSARLYGYLRVPREESYMQGSKEASPVQEDENLKAIAADLADEMDPETLYVLGPGSTISSVVEHLGLKKTLLGVDVDPGWKDCGLGRKRGPATEDRHREESEDYRDRHRGAGLRLRPGKPADQSQCHPRSWKREHNHSRDPGEAGDPTREAPPRRYGGLRTRHRADRLHTRHHRLWEARGLQDQGGLVPVVLGPRIVDVTDGSQD